MRELAVLYHAFSTGRPSPLAELSIQYADFAIGNTSGGAVRPWHPQLAIGNSNCVTLCLSWHCLRTHGGHIELPHRAPDPGAA